MLLGADIEIDEVFIGEDLVSELLNESWLSELSHQLTIEIRRAAILHHLLLFAIIHHHEDVLGAQHRKLHGFLNDRALAPFGFGGFANGLGLFYACHKFFLHL